MPAAELQQDPAELTRLIARCALREEAAFLTLYDATSAKLYGVVLRIVREAHWAEEVLQDVYMKVWRSASSYHADRGRPMTWLINIARNQAIDFVRSAEHTAAQRTSELDEDLPSDLDPLRSSQSHSEIELLARCLELLAEAQRNCLLMIYHMGYTPTEVAERQGHPLGTVKTWIRRGLERVRSCMRP